jgi:hypothetical protein
LHFCPLENHLMLVNLKVAINQAPWYIEQRVKTVTELGH